MYAFARVCACVRACVFACALACAVRYVCAATGDAEERLMEKWFGLIERKNDLASRETELVYQ